MIEEYETDPHIHVPSVQDTHCDNVDPNDKIIVILQQHVRLDKTSSNMGLELLSISMSKFSFCSMIGSELGIQGVSKPDCTLYLKVQQALNLFCQFSPSNNS